MSYLTTELAMTEVPDPLWGSVAGKQYVAKAVRDVLGSSLSWRPAVSPLMRSCEPSLCVVAPQCGRAPHCGQAPGIHNVHMWVVCSVSQLVLVIKGSLAYVTMVFVKAIVSMYAANGVALLPGFVLLLTSNSQWAC